MLPEAQKEILFGRQDLRQLGNTENHISVRAGGSHRKDGKWPAEKWYGNRIVLYFISFLKHRGWQPFKGVGGSKK